MAHAGTIDLGRQTRPANSRNPWLGVATFLALAAIAVMYLASAPGLTSGNLAAKSAADRSYDQIEAQRGVVTLPADNSYDQIEKLRLTGAAPAIPADSWSAGQYDVVLLPATAPQATSGTFHAGLPAPTLPGAEQLTSGTFHAGLPVVPDLIKPLGNLKTIDNPAKRDRVGGP